MEAIKITAVIKNEGRTEFYQTMESLEALVQRYCEKFEVKIEDNILEILIYFKGKYELERDFSNNEFKILKGTLRSLCKHIEIEDNIPE